MSFKIDTKEKFTVITPQINMIDANIAADLWKAATLRINEEYGNVILNLQQVATVTADAVTSLASLQQHFHAANKSFVICHISGDVMTVIKNEDLVDNLNITPTESEAWDVVQMEEIERELMDDFNDKEDELNG